MSTEQEQQLIVCMFVMCRSSLLPGVDLHMYGNLLHMLPTEDFLSPCILVRLSTVVRKTKTITSRNVIEFCHEIVADMGLSLCRSVCGCSCVGETTSHLSI